MKRIGVKKTAYVMKRITVKKIAYVMKGGPMDGQTLYLSSPGTLSFSLHGQTGHYNSENVWVPA